MKELGEAGATCEMKLEALPEHGTRTRKGDGGSDITMRGSWIRSASKLEYTVCRVGGVEVRCFVR